MPNIDTMVESKYLKQADFPSPALVTVRGMKQMNFAKQGQPAEIKWVIFFEEFEKGMVCGSTNRQLCANALGSKMTEDWVGKQVVVYNNPEVMFGNEVTGGLRIRARKQPATQQRPASARQPAPPIQDDDLPGSLGGEFDDLPY